MQDVKVAILGLGTVGSGIYRVIQNEKKRIEHKEGISFTVTKVLALQYSIPVPDEIKAKDIDEIANDPEIKIVAEVMGGIHPAKEFIIKCLEAGKTVVSANKELIAKNWPDLEKAAKSSGAGFYFEASVGGAIPIIKAMYDSLQSNTIDKVYGIINGTTNYILTKMSDEGRDFEDVLKEAQELGYAEANPTADVDAFDSMYKLSILGSLAFHAHVPVDHIYREGIRRITKADIEAGRELGYVTKLLAIGKRDGNRIEMRVHPTFIPKDHPLAAVKGSYNAIFVHGSAVDEMMFYGRGAGDLPTANALVSDMIYSLNTVKHKYTTFTNENEISPEIKIDDNWQTRYYLRIQVADKVGVIAKISAIFARNSVSIDTVIQKGQSSGNVPMIFITHKAYEMDMLRALEEIEKLDVVDDVVSFIRVED